MGFGVISVMSCSPHCNICKQFTGHCYSCKTGYHGGLCNEGCPLNCKGGCNRYTGVCVACVDGYAGRHCNSTCTSGCGICDFVTGHCISCKIGKKGKFCKESCPSTCISCDIHSGECEKCQPGYRGRFCVCHSNCEICDLTTGQCEQCLNNTFYGKSCSIPCPDACAGCEKATGSCVTCSQGYGRVYCDEMCTLCSPPENCSSKPCVHRDDQWLWKVLVGTLSTLCIVAVNVLLWVKRARRVRRSDVDQEDQESISNDPQEQPEYHLPYNHYHEIAFNDVDGGCALESDTCSKPLGPPLPAPRTIGTNNHRVTTQEIRHLDSDVPNLAISIRTLPPCKKSNKQKPQGNISRDTDDPLALPPPLSPRPKVTPIENHTRARWILQSSVLRSSGDPQVSDHRIIHPTICLQPLPLSQHTSSMSNAIQTPQGSKCLGADHFALNVPPLPRHKMEGRYPNRDMLHGRMFEADEVFEKTSVSVSNNVDQAVDTCHDLGHKMARTDDCYVEMRNFQDQGSNHHQRFLQRRHSDSELPTYECKTNERYHLDKRSKVDKIKSENGYFAYKGISRSFTSLNLDIKPTDIYITPVMDNMYRLSPHR